MAEYYDQNYSSEEEGDNEEINPFEYDYDQFYTDKVFDSREELTDWVSTTAKRLGFVLVTRRSKKNRAGIVTKVVFVCDRHGEYTGKGLLSSRATSTKKGGCPFELEGSYRGYDGWKVIVKNHNHNHSKSWGLQGHAYARRMTEQEKECVEELYALNLPVKDILSNLKQRFPENLSISNDIYNAIKDIKKKAEDEIGSSPMQVMLSLLRNNNYIFEYTLNDENQMENLFFVHPQSFEVWRAFPQLLIIDATYKTNVYNMPFVEVVGVTSTSKTFLVACAFVVNEKGGTYDWVLLRLNEVLGFNKVTAILKTPKVLAQTRGRPKKNQTGYALPDLNKPQPFKVPQPLAKSRSMHTQISRHVGPNKDLISESARHSAYIVKAQPHPIKDPYSQSARHSSYTPRNQAPPMIDPVNVSGRYSSYDYPESESRPCSSNDLSQWIIETKSLRPWLSPPRQDEQNLAQWLFGTQTQAQSQPQWVHDIPSSSRQSLIQPSNNRPYINDIPEVFRDYITRVVDVKADGNCGFRALAVAMGYSDTEENCDMVREQMLAEYRSRQNYYDEEILKKRENVARNISMSLFPRPRGYWMQTPDCAILLANRLGCIVVCLAPSGCTTIFPFEQSPEECEPHRIYSIASVWAEEHYVMVELSDNFPLPMVMPLGPRRSHIASSWEAIYKDRMDHYLRLTRKPAGYANLESSHSSYYY